MSLPTKTLLLVHIDDGVRESVSAETAWQLRETVPVLVTTARTIVGAVPKIETAEQPFDFIAMQASHALGGFSPGGTRAGYMKQLSPSSKLCIFGTGFEDVNPADLPDGCEDLTQEKMEDAIANLIRRHSDAQ